MAALIVIDMQRAIDAAYWAAHGPRNNRNAEETGQRLLAAWRRQGLPVYHVRHDSVEPESSYRPGQPGNDFKRGFEPLPHEPVIPKHTGSAFTNTGFENLLREAGIADLTVFGVITNNSVETTVRHAGTLGFRVRLVEDACFTFGKQDPFTSSVTYPAETVHALSLANLDGEYATIATAAEVLADVPGETLILPYFERAASFCEHDPRTLAAAARIPGFEHAGSTSVPGCPGKGILDGIIAYEPGTLDATVARLRTLGFQKQPGRDPWPDTRPMLVGAIAHEGAIFRIHAHVLEAGCSEIQEMRAFRDHLRTDNTLLQTYAAAKRSIVEAGITDSLDYCGRKGEFVSNFLKDFRARRA